MTNKDNSTIKSNKEENKQQDEQKNNLSPEELKQKQEEFLKEFMEKNTKELKLPKIPLEYKREATKVIQELEKSKKEIEEKKMSFVEQYKKVQDKLQNLSKAGKIKLNPDELENSQASFARYENSLNQVLNELVADINFYTSLLGEKPLGSIKVFKTATDDPIEYLNQKLKATKKSIKKILKDVRISYSRYSVGLEEQIRKLNYLDAYLKSLAEKQK